MTGAAVLVLWLAPSCLLLALSAFFTATQTAILCSHRPDDEVAEGPRARSHAARERLTAAILIGDTLCKVGLVALVTTALATVSCPLPSWIAAAAMTLVVVVAAELVPREVGRQRADGWLARTRRPMRLVVGLLSPAARLLDRSSRMMLLLVGLDPHELHPKVASGDLRFLLKTGAAGALGATGTLSERDLRMITSAFTFSDITVREVMVTLTEVKALKSSARARDALEVARAVSYTRFPVYGTRFDEILGVVNVYDILYSEFDPDEPLKRFMRPGLFVPNTVAIDKLLFQMQRRKTPMAIVVDEFGAADGIVTVDDIVEEVIGAFEADGPTANRPIQRQADGTYLLDGHVALDQLNEELKLDLPKKNYETLAGFLMTEMEKVPEEGDRFKFANLVFSVVKAKRHTLQKVHLRLRS